MQIMGDTILLKIIMATNPPPPIITIPITLIRMATITIPILKDMRNGENTRALSTGGRADIPKGAVPPAGGAGTEVWRFPGPRCLHTVPKRH
jgi:hypothetical protein